MPRDSSISYHFPQQAYNLAAVDLSFLMRSQIRGVILDLDNTIVSEDDRYLSPRAEEWIQQAKERGLKFFIMKGRGQEAEGFYGILIPAHRE